MIPMVETTSPFLVNTAGKATLHRYLRSERTHVINGEARAVEGTAHIYECTKTGAERRWGFDR